MATLENHTMPIMALQLTCNLGKREVSSKQEERQGDRKLATNEERKEEREQEKGKGRKKTRMEGRVE